MIQPTIPLNIPGRGRARRTDPETSIAAARSVKVTEMQGHVLDALDDSPCTDEELIARIQDAGIKATPQGVRSRRAELVEKGLVEFSGKWGHTHLGNKSRVWQKAAGQPVDDSDEWTRTRPEDAWGAW